MSALIPSALRRSLILLALVFTASMCTQPNTAVAATRTAVTR